MTLVVTINGPETIWLLADRRLSYKVRPPKEDGCKVMVLETTDGVAILGYAGLGATALGPTEPADWMSRVLRGRNLPLEHSLEVLVEAMKKQLPRHIAQINPPAHSVVVSAFLGKELRLYTIDLAIAADHKCYFRYTRHVINQPPAPPRGYRVAMGGTGACHMKDKAKWWTHNKRSLFHLICSS